MRRNRKAKIVATLGPASSSPEMLERLFRAGVDVFRINMSHTQHDLLRRLILDPAKPGNVAKKWPGFIARPGQRLPARLSRSSRILMKSFVKNKCALRKIKAPAWCFADIPMSKSSSSQLRKAGKWPV